MCRQARSRALWASTFNFLFIPSYSGCWSTLTRLILHASFERLDSQRRGKDDGDLIRIKLLGTGGKMDMAGNALKSLMLDNLRHGRKSIFCKRDMNNWIYLMSNNNLCFVNSKYKHSFQWLCVRHELQTDGQLTKIRLSSTDGGTGTAF